jgi:hypothetical protein
MKIFEILDEAKPKDGKEPKNKSSDPIRYNSEVGVLYGLIGADTFDLDNLSQSIPGDNLVNPELTYSNIKKYLAPVYDSKMFLAWAAIGRNARPKIREKQGEEPTRLSWVGGENIAGGVTDIQFESGPTAGISIKGKSGITLANLTPKSLGIDLPRGMDGFREHTKDLYDNMKRTIFTEVLNIAKSQPGVPVTGNDQRFTVTYMPKTDTFQCVGKASGGMQTINWPESKILNGIEVNSAWQRPFGDWFQANWSSKKGLAKPLFIEIAKVYGGIIENHLKNNQHLAHILRFGPKPYYYCTPKNLYFVPSIEQAQDIELKSIQYGDADGTGQLFLANIGRAGSDEYATVDIYMRYANGMFAANPTIRVQSLKNPQYFSWELL